MSAANRTNPADLNSNAKFKHLLLLQCCTSGLLLKDTPRMKYKAVAQFPREELYLIYEMASVSMTQRQQMSRIEPFLFSTQWPQHQQLSYFRNHLSNAKYTKWPQGARN